MPKALRVGDYVEGDFPILSGVNTTVFVDGSLWAVAGHSATPHPGGLPCVAGPTMTPTYGVHTVFVSGSVALHEGDLATCGCPSKMNSLLPPSTTQVNEATGQGSQAPAQRDAEKPRKLSTVTIDGVTLTINAGVSISSGAQSTLARILKSANLTSATITSGVRNSTDQARVMYDLIVGNSVEYAKGLYGSIGDMIIDVYIAELNAGKDATQIKSAMKDKISELGPGNVSKHSSDTHDVMDIAPSSISNTTAFREALETSKESGTISNYISPPQDPAFHIEIPK